MSPIKMYFKEFRTNLKREIKKFYGKLNLRLKVLWTNKLYIIIGSGSTQYPGWIASEKDYFNICNHKNFCRIIGRKKIKSVLAEHVLEHIESEDLKQGMRNVYEFLESEGVFRIAVPDGFHQDIHYIENVRPGGIGCGSDDHKHLFNYQSLSQLLEECGFTVKLVEYWDEEGHFHTTYSDEDGLGYIQRSFINDSRNSDGQPNYTSLIIDAIKIADNS
jgi:predicted SAM-dependent methyltransferase